MPCGSSRSPGSWTSCVRKDPSQEREPPRPGREGRHRDDHRRARIGGCVLGLITVIQSWLSRERTRHLEIRWQEGDETKTITIDGDTSDKTIAEVAQKAMEHGAAP